MVWSVAAELGGLVLKTLYGAEGYREEGQAPPASYGEVIPAAARLVTDIQKVVKEEMAKAGDVKVGKWLGIRARGRVQARSRVSILY